MYFLYAYISILIIGNINIILGESSKLINSNQTANNYQFEYITSKYQLNDRIFLRLLTNANESWSSGDRPCYLLMENFNSSGYNSPQITKSASADIVYPSLIEYLKRLFANTPAKATSLIPSGNGITAAKV